MRLDYTASSLIILGGWNPHIVNDVWIRKNLLDNPNEQPDIGLNSGVSLTGIPIPMMDAMFSNVRLAVIGDRLQLNLRNSEDFTHIENCVRKLCDKLPNTLVTGYGVNLHYADQTVSNGLMKIFSHDTLSENSFTQSHTYNVNLDGITTNISIDINRAENKSSIRFNFHFNKDVNLYPFSTIIQRMSERPISLLKKKAVEFAENQYELRLEN